MINAVRVEKTRKSRALTMIKVAHTAIWAFFAGSILILPIAALLRHFDWAVILTGFVLFECGVLAANRGQCPLTRLAARYTAEQSVTFDIYLPEWLAAHNKAIFGILFVVNEGIVLWLWRH